MPSNRLYQNLLFTTLTLCTFSCTTNLDIEIENQDYSLVINSMLSAEDEIVIGISKSSAISDTNSSFLNDSDLEVRIYENNVLQNFPQTQDDNFYYLSDCFPQEGYIYSIETHSPYGISTARDTVPKSIGIDSLFLNKLAYTDEDGFIKSEIRIVFCDDINLDNYYEFELWQATDLQNEHFVKSSLLSTNPIITSEQYYPENLILSNRYPESLPFSDVKFNGEQVDISLIYGPPIILASDGNGNFIQKIGEHKIILKLKSISRSYYLYKTSLLLQLESHRGDLISGMQTPIEVYSNIENGLGIFAASSSCSSDTILITE